MFLPILMTEGKAALEVSVTQVWSVAAKLAEDNFEKARQEATETVADIATERDEAFAEVRCLENEIAQMHDKLNAISSVNDRIKTDLNNQHTITAELKEKMVISETRLQERERELSSVLADMKEQQLENKTLQKELLEIAKAATRSS